MKIKISDKKYFDLTFYSVLNYGWKIVAFYYFHYIAEWLGGTWDMYLGVYMHLCGLFCHNIPKFRWMLAKEEIIKYKL